MLDRGVKMAQMNGNMFSICFIVILFMLNVSVDGQPKQYHHLSEHKALQGLLNQANNIVDPLTKNNIPSHYLEIANKFFNNLEQSINWTECELDTYKVLKDLTHGAQYALKYVDSFAKPPSGILDGNFNWLGSYDECKQKFIVNGTDYFEGNYCKVSISLPSLDQLPPGTQFAMGICVPSSCSENQTETFINFGMDLLRPVVANISTHDVICDKKVEWKTSNYIAVSVTGILVALSVIGTICDIIRRSRKSKDDVDVVPTKWNGGTDVPENGYIGDDVGLINEERHEEDEIEFKKPSQSYAWCENVMDFFICFSWISNGGKILNTSTRTGYLGAINGIRVISMSWVILGHTYVFGLGNFSNMGAFLSIIERFTFQAISNATVSVDSFFFLSGLLVCYLTLNELRKNGGSLNWFYFYFHRYWRLTPALMYTILLFVGIFPLLIKGPYALPTAPGGKSGDVMGEGSCEKYWWANMLYINNFVPSGLTGECLGWGWYLANDMQFYLISPIMIYLLYRYLYVGIAFIVGLIIFCLGITGGIATKNHLSASLLTAMIGGAAEGGDGGEEFMKVYVRPYYRIAPYLVGMLTGYCLHRYKNTFRPHWLLNLLGWCTASTISLLVIYGLYHYNHTMAPIPQGVSSFYVAANRFAWALGLAWLSFACITGNGGPVNAILSHSLWAPLGRLTYCAYLVHPIVMYVAYLNMRTPIHYTDITVAYYFIGHFVLAYACAFIVSLLIESPLLALEKLIFTKIDSAKKK